MVSIRSWVILAVLAGSYAWAQPADEKTALAERFVRAAEQHEQSAMGLRMLADKLRNEGKINDAQFACMKKVDGADFLPVMTQIATVQLTAAEMQEAIGFFESSGGKKYLQMSAMKSAEKAGVKPEIEMPDFTPKEYEAVNDFGTTKLYQKLVNEAVMTRSAAARPLIQARTTEIMQGCLRR